MKEEEIELNTAILAWEKGFPKKLGKITQSLLQRWLREKHNIHIGTVCNNLQDLLFSSEIIYIGDCLVTNTHKTYEKALEEGLYEALKLIKTK